MATPSKLNRTQGFPESLHDIAQSQASPVGANFVNPGTPASALVSREQMAQATIRGNGASVLKANLIKG